MSTSQMHKESALRSRFWFLVTVVAVVLIGAVTVAAACSSSDNTDTGTRVDMTATDFAFQPAEIRIKAQQQYEIRMRNQGRVPHDWTIDEIPATNISLGAATEHDMEGMAGTPTAGGMKNLHMTADPGKSADVSFMPMQRGEYVFYCTIPGHREAGMEGKLVVEQ